MAVTATQIMSKAAGVGQAIFWVFIVAIIAGIIIFLVWWYSHKVIFIIRKVAGDRTLTKIDKCRIIRKKGKPIKWKLRGMNLFVPVPPKKAIDVTTKGKLFVEAYFTEDGEFHYIIDKLEGQIGSLHPVTNIDKEFYAQQVEEGKKYEQKGLKDILLQMAPYMIVVIILAVFLIFFNDAVQPTIDLASSLQSASKTLADAANNLATCSQSIPITSPI